MARGQKIFWMQKNDREGTVDISHVDVLRVIGRESVACCDWTKRNVSE